MLHSHCGINFRLRWYQKGWKNIKVTETFKHNNIHFIDIKEVSTFSTTSFEHNQKFNESFNIIVFFSELLMERNQRF